MSKIFHKIGLFLLTILFLFACDDSVELGLDLQSQDQLISTYLSDTFSIESQVVISEPNSTSKVSSLLFGSLQDPYFGSIEAEAYAKMLLSTDTALAFKDPQGRKPIYDSARIIMVLDDIYGDTTTTKKLEVHRLLDNLDTGKTYYANDRIPSGELIASASIVPKTNQRIYYLPVKDEFGKLLFSKQGTETFANQNNFEAFFSGIRIRCADPKTVFELRPYNLFLSLHFHYDTDTLAKTHSFRIARSISNFDGSISLLKDKYQWFNSLKTDYSSSNYLKNLTSQNSLSSKQTNQELYVQAGADVMTWIKFPNLDKINVNKNIFINRAELSFHIDNQTFAIFNQVPPDLTFWEADKNGKVLKSETGNSIPVYAEGANTQLLLTYNPTGRNYKDALLTSYIQDVINGKKANNGILLRANGFSSSIRKVILNGRREGKEALKLKIYYTVIKSR